MHTWNSRSQEIKELPILRVHDGTLDELHHGLATVLKLGVTPEAKGSCRKSQEEGINAAREVEWGTEDHEFNMAIYRQFLQNKEGPVLLGLNHTSTMNLLGAFEQDIPLSLGQPLSSSRHPRPSSTLDSPL